jgi:hypothetical protein
MLNCISALLDVGIKNCYNFIIIIFVYACKRTANFKRLLKYSETDKYLLTDCNDGTADWVA